jgi:arginyl-tRNA synthetase
MNIEFDLKNLLAKALYASFQQEVAVSDILLQPTKKEFEGTYTFVTFGLSKSLRLAPGAIAETLGKYLLENDASVLNYNVVQGFLNISLKSDIWIGLFRSMASDTNFGIKPAKGQKVMVEYSSPNTNKPLHLGHLRNNFLGFSVANILKAEGFEVQKTNIINNRGIHICKSMLAYQLFGEGQTPASTGLKGDHLVGKFYVEFDKAYKAEVLELMSGINGLTEEDAKKNAPLMIQAQEMLLKWEQGDADTFALWHQMNQWVYDGFEKTYKLMGVDFDSTYYESDTYLLGKDTIEEGLKNGVFYQKEDNSIWIDLSDEGLDHKLVLRKDGTSVYITQDLGLADKKFEDFPMQKSVYVVGNEQDYHFEVLFRIMKKLGRQYAEGLFHLSYGMVDLPTGRMKSREGTVVDADDLIQEMINTAKTTTIELGKIEGFSEAEAEKLFKTLALGALKYFLLKVDPKKRMTFNPQESIEFQGNTGPFIQYTYARISAILRKAATLEIDLTKTANPDALNPIEQDLIFTINQYADKISEAANFYSPATIANYVYDLAKLYNQFYNELSVFNEPNESLKHFRVALSALVGQTIKKAMSLLGIDVPERM